VLLSGRVWAFVVVVVAAAASSCLSGESCRRGEACRETDTILTSSPVCSSSMESLDGREDEQEAGRGLGLAGGQSRVCSLPGAGGGRGMSRSRKLVWEDAE
jgi:hypothetical protein